MTDADVLDWLDRLLDLQPQERSARLQRLALHGHTCHDRLVRLLSAALTVSASGVLQALVRHGLSEAALSGGGIALHPNRTIAGYRLLRELGRGGMAAVWLAERLDAASGARVAIKLPLFALGSSPTARFLQEKEVLAGLRHPHIARLYETGTVDGQAFMVLEYVDGMPITEYCDRNRLDIRARLQLFLQVLDAVGHAHQRSVVHRDLKPSNILVDVEGQAKLLDFGISKLLVDHSSSMSALQLTQYGDAVLTPSYAAPEQANGGEISTLTDIFVLGVVLHQLLTGTMPYARVCGAHPTLGGLIDALLRSPPTRPSEAHIDEPMARARGASEAAHLQSLLRGDLDAIVQRAMQFEPELRYVCTEALAEDVRGFLGQRLRFPLKSSSLIPSTLTST